MRRTLLLCILLFVAGTLLNIQWVSDLIFRWGSFFGQPGRDFANGWATLISGLLQVGAVFWAAMLTYGVQRRQVETEERRHAFERQEKAAVLDAFAQDVLRWTERMQGGLFGRREDGISARETFDDLEEYFKALALIPPIHLQSLCHAFPPTIAPMALLNEYLPLLAQEAQQAKKGLLPGGMYKYQVQTITITGRVLQLIAACQQNAETIRRECARHLPEASPMPHEASSTL